MTSTNLAPNHHHPSNPYPSTRRSTQSTARSDSYPRSPSPFDTYYEPAVRLVDDQELPAGQYNTDCSAGQQPFAQGSEDISADDLADMERQYFALSQSSSPNHSPTRKLKASQAPSPMYPKPPRRVISETLGLRPEFLDKYEDLNDFMAKTPSPTDEYAAYGSEDPFTTTGRKMPPWRTGTPEREAPITSDRTDSHFRYIDDAGTPRGTTMTSYPNHCSHSGSIRPLFANEFTDSPGMRARSVSADDTPSLRPSLTLLAPVLSNTEIFDEEAVVIEEDEEDEDDNEPPPDSYMTKASDDFDDETDVELDGDEGDVFNSVIPLGFSVAEEFNDSEGGLEDGVGLFGGRIEDQYWRQEERTNGNGLSHSSHSYYPHSGESTPRQQHISLPTTPMGLGIKLSST